MQYTVFKPNTYIPNLYLLRPVYDVYINGKPTQPDIVQMLWVLPELAPVKGSSIPKSIKN